MLTNVFRLKLIKITIIARTVYDQFSSKKKKKRLKLYKLKSLKIKLPIHLINKMIDAKTRQIIGNDTRNKVKTTA